jgi:uncharacterized protein YaaN involved in tellurite resistance
MDEKELVIMDNDTEEKVSNLKEELRNSKEVLKMAGDIDVYNSNSILAFGNAPAQEISKFSDKILGSIKSTAVEDSGIIIRELTNIMKKFDKEDFEEKKEGFFSKMFSKSSKVVDSILAKYKSMGSEIDKIYIELNKYKEDIKNTNDMLENLYNQNLQYYKELEKFIIAGNMVVEKLETDEIPKLQIKSQTSGDELDIINLQNAQGAVELFKQRLYDLECAKMVALQTAPQIRIIQKGNYKLVGKIQSSFIITIPVFKNGIIQAVALKRQKVISSSLEELDRTTNELLLKNAENIKNQGIDIARLSSSSGVKVETLEKTWATIMEGIEETKRVEEENRIAREEGTKRLQSMTENIKNYIR